MVTACRIIPEHSLSITLNPAEGPLERELPSAEDRFIEDECYGKKEKISGELSFTKE